MAAIIGLLTLDMCIPDASSLKDKRRVVKSLIESLGNRHNVSVAETEQLDNRSHATLAVAYVANDKAHVERVLSHVLATAEREHRAVIEGSYTEIL
jgi:hypothetical protein